ncbi:hypothetical protein [Nostoc sp. PCC 7107]|uniref:hypothetical protein n=1 Tax=Nostoc sp. PCC 7107 TaxID=317936 RepID=UPI00029F0BAE|nr:hypothetical protein [Nostoc sp. PCC 7107]AFY45464.1 hypothetical protein Nos7107_4946 [Nostoc sp. PCC 7107]
MKKYIGTLISLSLFFPQQVNAGISPDSYLELLNADLRKQNNPIVNFKDEFKVIAGMEVCLELYQGTGFNQLIGDRIDRAINSRKNKFFTQEQLREYYVSVIANSIISFCPGFIEK